MQTKPTIPPTIGRRVLLFIAGTSGVNDSGVPFDAGIAFVWGEPQPGRNTINCGYTDHAGVAHSATSVILHDRAQTTSDRHGTGENYAVWMGYQFEQALMAEAKKNAGGAPRGDVVLNKIEENGVPVAADGGAGAASGASAEGGLPPMESQATYAPQA